MLCSLRIKNLLLIENLELNFKAGLNTLTGETGVGKSVLLDCLGFALGWNNRNDLLRLETEIGEVTAEFIVGTDNELRLIFEQSGIPIEDTIIIRRSINKKEKRRRAFLNDKSITLEFLQKVSKHLVELQGQNENQSLLNEVNHRGFLDIFANIGIQLENLKLAWREIKNKQKILDQEIENLKQFELDQEYLKHSIIEIESLEVQENEEQNLVQKRKSIKSIQSNRAKVEKIEGLLFDTDFEISVIEAMKLLESFRISHGDIIDAPINALERTLKEFNDAQSEINSFSRSQNMNLDELEEIEDRIYQLREMGRKHKIEIEALPSLLVKFKHRLNESEQLDKRIVQLRSDLNEAEEAYFKMSKAVSNIRKRVAQDLDKQVMSELKDLRMADCYFKTEITEGRSGPKGVDDVVFKVKTNRGSVLDNLKKIASGGEMSRFLLALKVCLTKKEQGVTMIFDEIDRGIGGATADAVGRRLRKLSDLTQIIVVTHSPQVAAHGCHQWKVKKLVSKNAEARTDIHELNYSERLGEIARMLSGKEISSEARAAAKKLLG